MSTSRLGVTLFNTIPDFTGDQFKKNRKIGNGATGDVYRCTINSDEYAMKICTYSKTTFEYKNEILSEIEKYNHNNIIKHHAVFYQDSKIDTKSMIVSIIMEYLPYDLFTIINYPDVLYNLGIDYLLEFQLVIIKDIIAGLQCLHQHGIKHCDLKSQNILLTPYFNAKITDFDLAKYTKDKSKSGTMRYVAPELLNNGQNTTASDIYSLCVLIWAIIARREPFATLKNSSLELKEKARTNQRESIPENCDKRISKVITLGFLTNPEERPTIHEIEKIMNSDDAEEEKLAQNTIK